MSTLSRARGVFNLWFDKLWQFFAGGVVVLVAFMSNFIDLRQPEIAVEITGIEQITSATTDINSSPDFKSLRAIDDREDDSQKKTDLNADEMQRLVDRARSRLADTKADFNKFNEKLQAALQQPENSERENAPLPAPLQFLDEEDLLNVSKAKIRTYIEQRQTAFRTREELISLAEVEVKNYRELTERLEAKIVVTAAVSNSGDGATTLKPQALLRTDLGQGNYLDINLKVQSYGSGNSEIEPRSTAVLQLESQPIRRMAPDDRERFISFFRNTSPTNLFVTDVRGDYYKSNTIPFAQGIYEQKIYDGLKTFASSSRK
jgi:hypothetical protein